MPTYVITLALLAVFCGFFWNNGSARSDADSAPVQPARVDNPGSDRKERATRTVHQSNNSAS
jgi:hypothetical protein